MQVLSKYIDTVLRMFVGSFSFVFMFFIMLLDLFSLLLILHLIIYNYLINIFISTIQEKGVRNWGKGVLCSLKKELFEFLANDGISFEYCKKIRRIS